MDDKQPTIAASKIQEDPFRFDGRVVVITGGTRGIGLACARMMGGRGARIIVSSRKPAACESVVTSLRNEGVEAEGAPIHAASSDAGERLVEAALSRFGRLDIVVANAAINPVFDPLHRLADESWARILDMNLTAPLRLARAALPSIAERRGAMVFVSSVNASAGVPGSGAYGVSKAAIEQMVRQLAVEWGSEGVRVNAVAPSTTRTDMIRALASDPAFTAAVEARTPLRRIAEPEDVAAAIAFLASAAARHITGQVLRVDGGEMIARGLT